MTRSIGFDAARAIARGFVALCAVTGLLSLAPVAQTRAEGEATYTVDGSTAFRDALPANATVTEIWFYHDAEGFNGVQVHYQLDNGFFNMLPIDGRAIGDLFKFALEPGERLMKAPGTYDARGRVRSLSLVTDRRQSAVVGSAPGKSQFELLTVSDRREFAGFMGYMDPVWIAPQFVTRPARPRAPARQQAAEPGAQPAAAATASPATAAATATSSTAPPRAPVFKGWHVKSRDFTCQSNGSETDFIAEVYGDLTFAFDTGDGQRSVFLLSLARDYLVPMNCGSHAALESDGFQQVDLVILAPPRAVTAGGFWFISGLKEADDGSFMDPDNDLGGYDTVRYPFDTRVPAQTHTFDFTSPDPTGSAQLRILLDVKPVFE